MKTKLLICTALLPAALLLGGCGSAPMKSAQKLFDSLKPSERAATQQSEVEEPAEAATPARPAQSAGLADLQTGIARYEDGQYTAAQARFLTALASGLTPAEAVRAHKYLAFIHCASKREKACRSEFKRALTIDPAFQLNAAESGHPIWGRVFRDVKQRG